MSKVVVISGHPDLESSNTNTVILQDLAKQLESVDIRRLDTLYPDYQIDVEEEQKALLAAEVVILQFPFYWYSVPALLKKWLDDVFSYNFAYGAEGDKLKGKHLILSFTVGGPEESYDPLGYNHFTIEQLIKPLQQTAYLAGMNYVDPIYTHRMVYIPGVYNELSVVQDRAKAHADRLRVEVNSLLNSPESRIKQFIQRWFANFDVLPDDTDVFTDHLSENIKWLMPQGEFKGHQGFKDWYAIARETFKPNCDHQVEQVEIQSEGELYTVKLRVRFIAQSYSDSELKGEAVNMLVNEIWQLEFTETGSIQIHNYEVIPVNG